MVENRLSHQQQSLETAFTFTAGGGRKHKSPVSILPHTASSSMLLPSQQPSTSQVTFYSSENSKENCFDDDFFLNNLEIPEKKENSS